MEKTIVKIVDHLKMVGFIQANGTQCRFVSLLSETPVKNIKAACPFKGVIKVSRKYGMVNINYVESVQRKITSKLGLEPGTFEYQAGETWYKHLTTEDGKSFPIVVNKKTPDNGEFYLQFFPTKSTNAYHMPDGTPVSEDQLKPYFYKREDNVFKPTVICIKVSNIKELRASGIILQSEDIDEAEALLEAAQ